VRYVSPARPPVANDGIRFVTLAAKKNRVGRAFALLWLLARDDSDVFHFQDPESLPVAFALKLLFRKQVIYDAYEDFPSAIANKGSIPRILQPITAKIFSAVENVAARCFDGLMTADPLTLRRFARAGASKKLVFYNFPNLDFFPPLHPRPKPFDLVYRGGISERTGIYVLLEALRVLRIERFAKGLQPLRLLMVGYFDGPSAERAFCDRVRGLGLEPNVEIGGRIGHESMWGTLSEARIGVCPLLAVPKFQRNIPVKVFECWACGIPVIATDLPPIRPFFARSGRHSAGVLVPPGGAIALAQAIRRLLEHPEEAASMGARGRRLVVERFNNAGEARKLRRFIEKLVVSPDNLQRNFAVRENGRA